MTTLIFGDETYFEKQQSHESLVAEVVLYDRRPPKSASVTRIAIDYFPSLTSPPRNMIFLLVYDECRCQFHSVTSFESLSMRYPQGSYVCKIISLNPQGLRKLKH